MELAAMRRICQTKEQKLVAMAEEHELREEELAEMALRKLTTCLGCARGRRMCWQQWS